MDIHKCLPTCQLWSSCLEMLTPLLLSELETCRSSSPMEWLWFSKILWILMRLGRILFLNFFWIWLGLFMLYGWICIPLLKQVFLLGNNVPLMTYLNFILTRIKFQIQLICCVIFIFSILDSVMWINE